MLSAILFANAIETSASWLKTYPVREYGAFWHYDLEVRNLPKNKDKILDILRKSGGELTQPLENFPSTKDGKYQQLSYKIARNDVEKAFKELKKLTTIKRSTQKDDNSAYIEEATEKLIKLRADSDAGKDELKRLPAISELAGELQAHLEKVVGAFDSSKDRVLLNLVLEEKAAK